MIRTRDLLLFVILSLFLMGGITTTIFINVFASNQTAVLSKVLLGGPERSFSATLTEVSEPDKDTALLSMRERVLARRERVGSVYSLYDHSEELIESQIDDEFETDSTSPYYCGIVREFMSGWRSGAQIVSVEGARVVALVQGDEIQDVLLQFPQPFTPNPGAYCIPSQVIGVANDGSLIRNNEVSLYSIFSSETVVGYALDGFPIFGKNNGIATDACGGAVTRQGYGYVLQDTRDKIVHCFSAAPLHF